MFDGVAVRRDRVLQPLAAEHVTPGLSPELVRLVDDRLQHGQRILRYVLVLAVGAEGVRTARIQLDVIDTLLDVLADGGAPLVRRPDDDRGPGIGRTGGRLRAPDDAATGYLEPRAIELAVVDRVANVDVGVAVAV